MTLLDRVNEDHVELMVDGKTLLIAESYDVRRSIFDQPSSFEVKLGSKANVSEIAEDVKIGMQFGLFVATASTKGTPIQIMSGKIDAVDVSDGAGTIISIRGRDQMAPLLNASIRADESFSEATYGDLTRRVLDKLHMLDKNILVESNLANRKAVTGVDTITQQPEEEIEARRIDNQLEFRTAQGEPIVRRVRRTIKAGVGEAWWTFLKRQYKRAGLFLWSAGEGSFVLAPPTVGQPAIARIFRANPAGDMEATAESSNVLHRQLSLDYTNRHARVTAWGRAGRRMGGRSKFRGQVDDLEMIERGYDPEIHVIEIYDVDVKTNKEADYVARRWLSEERRDSWKLTYVMSGHSTPALYGGGTCIWAPDTIVKVDDLELGYCGMEFYVSEVSFSRGSKGTTTTLVLARTEDLVFAEEEQAP